MSEYFIYNLNCAEQIAESIPTDAMKIPPEVVCINHRAYSAFLQYSYLLGLGE